jgi:sugar lactone lactonase YvrE
MAVVLRFSTRENKERMHYNLLSERVKECCFLDQKRRQLETVPVTANTERHTSENMGTTSKKVVMLRPYISKIK